MLTNEEHQAMIMFDRLLMAARDNETVADLLDQTLNVARMIDPRPDDKVVYGPLQRMHFEWQAMQHRMNELGKKMDNYIAQQNRNGVSYPGTSYTGSAGMPMAGGLGAYATTTWPSNPGMDVTSYNYRGDFNHKPEVDWSNTVAPITLEQLKKMQLDISKMSIPSDPDVSALDKKTTK